MAGNWIDAVDARSASALATGALQPVQAEQVEMEEEGMRFIVRWVSSLAVKDAAKLNFGKDDVEAFKHYLDLCKEKKEAAKALSDLQAALTDKVLAKYAALSEEDIRRLVVEKKWMCSVMSSCMEEMQQVTQQLSAAITAVSARYERTLPSLEADAHRYEDEVNGYLKEMGFIL